MDKTVSPWLFDVHPQASLFAEEVLAGLRGEPRTLPCKYFYDQRGSQLFDAICELDEYYLTRTELAIMRRHAAEMAQRIGPRAMVIELGSGSSTKTRILLEHLRDTAAYVPLDIAREHLRHSAARLAQVFPQVEVLPLCADFTSEIELPTPTRLPHRKVVYFPGSTIGNFQPDEAHDILSRVKAMCGAGGGLLIGIDLVKETATLEAAYNDAAGVTAEFNLNLLRRINRELGANFDLDEFAHHALFNRDEGRMEIFLISQREQTVSLLGEEFDFAAGEPILTEYSHKYTIDGFATIAADAGLVLRQSWTDPQRRFAVLYLEVKSSSPSRTSPRPR